MYSWKEKLQREDRSKINRRNPPESSGLPSFSSSLLDKIYRSTDDGIENPEELRFCKDSIAKRQSINGGGVKAKARSSIEDEDMASLRRACLMEKLMEKKVDDKVSARRRQSLPESDRNSHSQQQQHDSGPLYFSSSSISSDSSSGVFSSSELEFSGGVSKSRTSCFVSSTPKPVRTSVSEKLAKNTRTDQIEYQEELKQEDFLIRSKLKALKIYRNLKKVKQPISPGGKLTSFFNSLFTTTNGSTNSKKTKNSSSSPIGGHEETNIVERKSKSTYHQSAKCSSASSYYRSCLTKSALNSKEKPNIAEKRTVKFSPVSVIVDEDCRPYGHKSVHEDNSGKYSSRIIKEEVKNCNDLAERSRRIENAAAATARDVVERCGNNDRILNADDEGGDVDDDAASDSSSDLFELDHLAISIAKNNRYCEELPVYETTRFHMNRAIAGGGLVR